MRGMSLHLGLALGLLFATPGSGLTDALSSQPDVRGEVSASYVVQFDEEDRRLAFVEARIRSRDEFLLMYPEGADHLPAGWSTFIRNMSATDLEGREVTLESNGRDLWRNPLPGGEELTLRYEILIHHDAGRWPFGWDEAAYVKGESIFLTGKALFITAFDQGDIDVRFSLPERWQLVTPWESRGSRQFVLSGPVELTESAIMAGRFDERTVEIGSLEVDLAVGHSLPNAAELFEETLRSVLPEAAAVFGGSPEGRYVIAANREEAFTGGGAFPRSLSLLFQDSPTLDNRPEWSHTMIHELLHLWIGIAISPPQDQQEDWFTEGVTDYLTNLVQVGNGLITEQTFWDRVADHDSKYQAAAGDVPLRDAGRDKGRHYDLIYSGGLVTALALDVEMRVRSGGKAGVVDLLREMYRSHGLRGVPFTAGDVVDATERLAGIDMTSFFESHLYGTTAINLGPILQQVGLRVVTGDQGSAARITSIDEPSPEQVRLRHGILQSASR
jgi:predicted metalloprotease with PDZ domain